MKFPSVTEKEYNYLDVEIFEEIIFDYAVTLWCVYIYLQNSM